MLIETFSLAWFVHVRLHYYIFYYYSPALLSSRSHSIALLFVVQLFLDVLRRSLPTHHFGGSIRIGGEDPQVVLLNWLGNTRFNRIGICLLSRQFSRHLKVCQLFNYNYYYY